jgi:hypothetical protein
VVFINEIHYDNTGTDVGEGVEIAGTAGTDLTGWSIIPYNGNGGVSYTPRNFIRHNPKPIQWFWNRFRINKWFAKWLLMVLH